MEMQEYIDYKLLSEMMFEKRAKNITHASRYIAKKIGLNVFRFKQIENNLFPTIEELKNICKWLEVPIETFIKTRETISIKDAINLDTGLTQDQKTNLINILNVYRNANKQPKILNQININLEIKEAIDRLRNSNM